MGILDKKILIITGAVVLILGLSTGAVILIKNKLTQQAEIIPEEKIALPIAPLMPPEISISASPNDIENNGLDKTIALKVNIKNEIVSCSYSWDKNLKNITSAEYLISIPKTIQTPQTYSVSCKGSSEQIEKSITLPIVAARPPAIGFTADRYEIEYGGSVMLTWSSQSATSCSLKNSLNKLIAGNLQPEGERKLTSLTASRAYIITCAGPGGITSESLPITVEAPIIVEKDYSATVPAAKTFTFSSNKTFTTYNSSITLNWSATNFLSCLASSDPYNADWSGNQSKSGQKEISNLIENTVFNLDCKDSSGNTAKKSAAISVGAASAPTIAFSANPNPISYNSSAELSWSATNANTCYASGSWHGEKPITGNENTAKSTINQFYTLACEGPGGVVSKSLSLTVGTKTYNYIWSTSSWSACSINDCTKPGTQTRQVTCKRDDGVSASADKCDASSKPSASQNCKARGYNTSGPYASCDPSGAKCPSSQGGNSSCTCQTNRWQSFNTCSYNSFSSGGNNYFDCIYTATIKIQECPAQLPSAPSSIAKQYRNAYWGCWTKQTDGNYQLQANSVSCGNKEGGSSCPGKIQSQSDLESNNEGCVYSSGCNECPSGGIEKN